MKYLYKLNFYHKIIPIIAWVTTASLLMLTASSAVDVHTGESEANISFTAGEGPTKPVNPEEPEKPMEPEPPGEGVEGSLVIVYTSDFNFGANKTVSLSTEAYDIETEQPNVQVADLRGNGKGWKLTAALGNFYKDTDSSTPTLVGSKIEISGGRPNSASPDPNKPVANTPSLYAGGSAAPVFTAAVETGGGLWVNRLYPGNQGDDAYVKLEVPAGAAATGNHTATIVWTLQDAP